MKTKPKPKKRVAVQMGWRCPNCGRGNAPSNTICNCVAMPTAPPQPRPKMPPYDFPWQPDNLPPRPRRPSITNPWDDPTWRKFTQPPPQYVDERRFTCSAS